MGLGGAGVEGSNLGVGMGTAEDLATYLPGHFDIPAIGGLTGDFIHTVVSDRPLANYVVLHIGKH
jgi:hypothetical protein